MNYNQQMEMETVPINNQIRLLNLGKTESWKTQAVYHALAERMTEESQDTIIICQPETPYLSLGYFQSYDSIFDRSEVERLKLPVYSRRIGGGATYLDKNQLFYQFIFHHSRAPVALEKAYKTFLAAPVETLKSFGLDCRLRALNEIEVNGKRIAGIGGGRIGDAAVVVGNFLIDFDFEAMSAVWKSPWSGFRELAQEALMERIYTLKQCAPFLSMKKLSNRLIDLIPKFFSRPFVKGELTKNELEAAQNESEKLILKNNKNWNDNYAETKQQPLKISADVFIHSNKIDLNGHSLHISYRTDNEIVTDVKIESPELESIANLIVNKHQDDIDGIINNGQ